MIQRLCALNVCQRTDLKHLESESFEDTSGSGLESLLTTMVKVPSHVTHVRMYYLVSKSSSMYPAYFPIEIPEAYRF